MTPLAVSAPDVGLPIAFTLSPIYPNPTAATATTVVTLPKPSSVTIKVIDVAGRTISSTNTGMIPEGESVVQLDLQSLSPGRYLIGVTANGISCGKGITVVR